MFDINEYLKEYEKIEDIGMSFGVKRLAPKIVCDDGFDISIQASHNHYCTPRIDRGPYSKVEAGFPSESEELLMPFAEDIDNPTETVYGWVPVEVINEVIEKHGGL